MAEPRMQDRAGSKRRGLTDSQWLIRGALGAVLYAALALVPLILMLTPSRPTGRTFLREFSVALAFGGMAMLGLQVLVTARLRRLKAPYGIDAVYHFHRAISFVSLALVFAHPVLLIVDDRSTLSLFNVFSSPLRARFAVLALVALVAIIVLSSFRQPLRLSYERWRRSHGALALLMLCAAVAHIELVGYHVNSPFKRELWLAYPALWIAVIVWTRVFKPARLLRQPWTVESVREERGRAWTLSLASATDEMQFNPGQFVWLHLGASPFAMAEHPFSVASSAERPESLEVTIKELGDFTSGVGLTPTGQVVYVDGPYGQFSVDRHAADNYVFIVGGVGITPVMSMLRTLADRSDLRPLTLIYGAATLDDMTFREELELLEEKLSLKLVLVPTEPPPGWEGERGRVDEPLLRRHASDVASHAEFFVCGPEAMMQAVSGSLRHIGVHPRQIRYEMFGLV